MDKSREKDKKLFTPKDKERKDRHKELITHHWSEATVLSSKMAKSMYILSGFEFYPDDLVGLKINMANVKGRKMISAEDILKAEAYQDIAKEKVKENKFKNLFK